MMKKWTYLSSSTLGSLGGGGSSRRSFGHSAHDRNVEGYKLFWSSKGLFFICNGSVGVREVISRVRRREWGKGGKEWGQFGDSRGRCDQNVVCGY